MRILLSALAALIVLSYAYDLHAQSRSPAETLTIIQSPPLRERDTVLRRFEFLLGQFSDICRSDPAPAHDMLAVGLQQLEEAGLEREESLLDLANNLYRMAQETRAAGAPLSCAEMLAAYLVSRQGGFSQTESRDAVIALASLGGLSR